eukprot:Skav223981  [mRNA]  locus=scaffold1107:398003:399442:- [translate_table: standard]
MGDVDRCAIFPLPTSRDMLVRVLNDPPVNVLTWVLCMCLSLNSLWGSALHSDREPNAAQLRCLGTLVEDARRFCEMEATMSEVEWKDFFRVRSIDYKGDEVRTARWFKWVNVSSAFPTQVGAVPLAEVCTRGSRFYVENFDLFLKPASEWGPIPRPRVMVHDDDWGEVCKGLVQSGVCTVLREDQVFKAGDELLLNGMFGVPKDEVDEHGNEVFRLIMNLIPLNSLCRPMSGDIDTLPSWSMMSPFFVQPHENILISSEDVKCFFYTLQVPDCWIKYLAFNKPIPCGAIPGLEVGGTYYIASRVLPMGFLNSVSLAQHVHRSLVQKSSERQSGANAPESELRKDMLITQASPAWRVYLDNYDLIERVEATGMIELEGSVAPGVLCLRQEYEHWSVPRNTKKAVQRSSRCEMQGALVDGVAGIACPRDGKLAKYLFLAFKLCQQQYTSQKECQGVCGGQCLDDLCWVPLIGYGPSLNLST